MKLGNLEPGNKSVRIVKLHPHGVNVHLVRACFSTKIFRSKINLPTASRGNYRAAQTLGLSLATITLRYINKAYYYRDSFCTPPAKKFLKKECVNLAVYVTSLCLYVCACMTVCMCVCMHICMSVYLYVCVPVWLCVCISVSLYIYNYVCVSVCLYVCMSVYPYIYMSVCLYVCVCMSIYLCVYMSV